jgi:Uma2 family endonuclease
MADRVAPAPEMTFEEFELRYAGKRYEYVDGRPVPMGPEIVNGDGEVIVSPTKPQHALMVDEIQFRVGHFVREHHLGRVFGAEMGFLMQQDPFQMRAADVAFVPYERLNGVDLKQWLPFAPDLAVEVISEYEKAADIRRKAQSYMDNGTRLLLVVYPDTWLIDAYRPGQAVLSLGVGDVLDAGDVLPGFHLDVGKLFAILSE